MSFAKIYDRGKEALGRLLSGGTLRAKVCGAGCCWEAEASLSKRADLPVI